MQDLIDNDKSPKGEQWTVDEIEAIVTAKNLCACINPITASFEVTTIIITGPRCVHVQAHSLI